ncbi:TIGR03936 family radical SAM-associated protein [Ruminiclostridium cellulolyticum]|uniref:DUF2344 domain-containing protein n=1 Tax=Ruminiclostridium cellulolyticum (strain ATCC 35319 / DSM 5812 / JCM 6584 / H10) TaxID=394503 RepID=B8I174_RUMCH|nr:TIGR03936 family radical SAM-associated protein [Ruminiclostridium cellulolyticum]ACL75672.1 conserved hypothetical protein [Ruminiclostridium cellulolyticum H10]
MTIIRVKFRRGDEVKFISHLDLMKVFERAIRRARLPIAYSQGFNPHPCMVFGLPLGVGVTSEAEYGDFEITDDEMPAQEFVDKLNEQLPAGIEILSAKKKLSKQNIMATIAAAEYIVIVGTPAECNEKTIKGTIDKYLLQKEIIVKKRTKSGVKDVNIRDMIFDLNFKLQPCGAFNIMKFTVLVSAGSKANLKPDLLIESLCGYLGFEFEIDRIHRTKLFVRSQDQLLDPMEDVI